MIFVITEVEKAKLNHETCSVHSVKNAGKRTNANSQLAQAFT